MHKSERIVREYYERQGYTVLHSGAPDFLCFKRNESGVMYDILFTEVKREIHDTLGGDQELWQEALQTLEVNYRVTTEKEVITEEYVANEEYVMTEEDITNELERAKEIRKGCTRLFQELNEGRVIEQQKVIPESKAEEYLKKGFRFVASINGKKVIVESVE